MKLFTLRDIKSERYAPPTPSETEATFLRDISRSLSDPKMQGSPFYDHPEDFQLYLIGEFNIDTAVLTPVSPHVSLGTASDYRRAASTAA